MTTYYVYEFRGNGLVYFGATINPESRRKNHLNAKCKSQSSMFHFLEKYGSSSFSFKVLFSFDNSKSMRDKEIELIKNEIVDRLINKRKGGEWYRKNGIPSMKKIIDFKEDMIGEVQSFADLNFEGNFSQSVRHLITKGLGVMNE